MASEDAKTVKSSSEDVAPAVQCLVVRPYEAGGELRTFPVVADFPKCHTIGVEKTDVVHTQLHSAEQRAESLHGALQRAKAKVLECHRSKPSTSADPEKAREKRKKKLVEYDLYKCLKHEAKTLAESLSGDSVLRDAVALYATALDKSMDETVECEAGQEATIDKLNLWVDEENKSVKQLQTKLKNLTLDMDGARARLEKEERSNGDDHQLKIEQLRKEFDEAYLRMEACRDNLAFEVYTTAAKEIQGAKFFENLAQQQLEYHKAAVSIYSEILPQIATCVADCRRRPVYGCPLEDHLRYSDKSIAIVIEACCAALLKKGAQEEGIFRISGTASKVKRLRAAFDAGEVDLIDCYHDPHAVASALKSYLRELPDSLMTHYLYEDWVSAGTDSDSVRALLARLPAHCRDNLGYLVKFCGRLCGMTAQNKMDAKNLGIVLGPNLLWSPTAQPGSKGVQDASRITEFLIAHADELFPGDVNFDSPLIADYAAFVDAERAASKAAKTHPQHSAVDSVVATHTDNHVPTTKPPPQQAKTGLRPKAKAPPPPSQHLGLTSSRVATAPIATMDEEQDEEALTPPEAAESHHAPRAPGPRRAPAGPAPPPPAHGGPMPPPPPPSTSIGWNEDMLRSIDPTSDGGGGGPLEPGPLTSSRSAAAAYSPTVEGRGHRKTASLDVGQGSTPPLMMTRPKGPPPAPAPKQGAEADNNLWVGSSTEQKRHSAHVPSSREGRVKEAKGPHRPPPPSREILERHSSIRASTNSNNGKRGSLAVAEQGDNAMMIPVPRSPISGMATFPVAKPRRTKEREPALHPSSTSPGSSPDDTGVGEYTAPTTTTTITVDFREPSSPPPSPRQAGNNNKQQQQQQQQGLVSHRKTMFGEPEVMAVQQQGGCFEVEKCPPDPPQTPPSRPKPPLPLKPGGGVTRF